MLVRPFLAYEWPKVSESSRPRGTHEGAAVASPQAIEDVGCVRAEDTAIAHPQVHQLWVHWTWRATQMHEQMCLANNDGQALSI